VSGVVLQEMLGYPESELQSRTASDIAHEEDRAATEARIAKAQEGRRRVYRLKKRYLRKDGTAMWADVSSVFVPASGSNSPFSRWLQGADPFG
jgi:PAS domain S-box-containing protein